MPYASCLMLLPLPSLLPLLLLQHPHFPTRSYYRGWVANMVMACVMVALYIIIIAAACASSNTYYRRYYGYGY